MMLNSAYFVKNQLLLDLLMCTVGTDSRYITHLLKMCMKKFDAVKL